MSKIRNVSGEDRVLPWLDGRLVMAGQIIDVPSEHVYNYTCQESMWKPADDEAQALHDKAVAELVKQEEPELVEAVEAPQAETPVTEEGN
jgi:hypothetical protein